MADSVSGQSSFSAFISQPFVQTFTVFYMIFQSVLSWFFAPSPPPSGLMAENLPKKRVAVIGSGVTGVSSAAHCVGHGFDVQLFEKRSKEKGLGGIWSVSLFFGNSIERLLTAKSESIRRQLSRSIVSCIDSIRPCIMTLLILPKARFGVKSSGYGSDTICRTALRSKLLSTLSSKTEPANG